MSLKVLAKRQIEEALGPVNRWYCGEHYRREINDPNQLIEYYIKSGGASDFARRHPRWSAANNVDHCQHNQARSHQV